MKRLLITLLLAAIPTYAQVQIGKNVQIGAGGTGSGNVSGQASGVIPLATGTTTIGAQSHLSDNGTTVTSSEPIAVNAGSQGGTIDATEGTPATPTTGHDVLYSDATSHCLKYSANGGTFNCLGTTYTTFSPAPLSNTNVVGAGDSRMAGNMVPAGQDFLTYLAAQPQFSGRATFYNGAVGGAGCSAMTSSYAANIQPHKPAGAITIAYLFIEIGINDLNAGTGASVEETCLSSYITTALADGFTPVLFTVYYSGNSSDAQDVQRQIFNDWIRQQPYLVIDVDHLFPSNSTSDVWHVNADHLNGLGNQLWARETNFLWGLGKSGTTYGPSVYHDYENPQSGQKRVSGALISGIANSAFNTPGFIGAFNATNKGAVFFGTDSNGFIYRNATTDWQWASAGLPLDFDNSIRATYFASNGTTFSVSGCGTATSLVGGASAGKFVGASTTCNPVITMGGGATAPNGWACRANDFTTNITFRQTATTTTTATMTSSGTAGATDTINFECIAY